MEGINLSLYADPESPGGKRFGTEFGGSGVVGGAPLIVDLTRDGARSVILALTEALRISD